MVDNEGIIHKLSTGMERVDRRENGRAPRRRRGASGTREGPCLLSAVGGAVPIRSAGAADRATARKGGAVVRRGADK